MTRPGRRHLVVHLGRSLLAGAVAGMLVAGAGGLIAVVLEVVPTLVAGGDVGRGILDVPLFMGGFGLVAGLLVGAVAGALTLPLRGRATAGSHGTAAWVVAGLVAPLGGWLVGPWWGEAMAVDPYAAPVFLATVAFVLGATRVAAVRSLAFVLGAPARGQSGARPRASASTTPSTRRDSAI